MAHVCRICMRMAISITPAPRGVARGPASPLPRGVEGAAEWGPALRYVYYSGPRRSVLLFGRYPPHIEPFCTAARAGIVIITMLCRHAAV